MNIVYEANIDGKMLKKQRRDLAKILYGEKISKEELHDSLEGVLNLLEDIQDKIDDAAKTKKA